MKESINWKSKKDVLKSVQQDGRTLQYAIGKPHIKTIASHIDKITPTLEKHFPLPKIKIKNYFSLLANSFTHGRLLSSFSNSTR